MATETCACGKVISLLINQKPCIQHTSRCSLLRCRFTIREKSLPKINSCFIIAIKNINA